MPEPDAGTNPIFHQTPGGGSKPSGRGRGEFERVRWILVSYFTSPMFLVIAGFGMLLLAAGWVLPDRFYRYHFVQSDAGAAAPAVFLARDPPLVLCLLPPMLFLAIGIGVQLSLQFRNPLARLAPKFTISHAMVGIGLALAVVLLCAVQLMIGGAQTIPALVVPACMVAVGIAYTASALLAGSVGLQGKTLWLIIPHLAAMVAGFVMLIFDPDRILRGEYHGVLVLLAAVAAAECGLATWALSRLVDWSSASVTPQRAAWVWEHPVARSFGLGRLFRVRRPERRLEALLSATGRWSWWNRVERWRLGNPPMPRLGFSFAFLLLIAEVALVSLLQWKFVPSPVNAAFITYFIWNWFLIDTFQVATRWRMRMPILSLELMRPYSRRTLLWELIAGLVLDLAPFCVLFAAMLAFVLNLDAAFRIDWARLPGEFIFWLLFGFVVQVETAAVQIVIKRLWLAWTAGLLSLFVSIAVVLGLLVARISNLKPLAVTHAMVESQLWAPAVIAVIVSAVMARRFFQMEIGRRV